MADTSVLPNTSAGKLPPTLTDAQVLRLEARGALRIKRILYHRAEPFRTGFHNTDAVILADPTHLYRRNCTCWNKIARVYA